MKSLFKYGKKAGYMSIALIVVAIVPLIAILAAMPSMPAQIATRFNAAGKVIGRSDRVSAFLVPGAALIFGFAMLWNAFNQARNIRDSKTVAANVCQRYLRSGIVTMVILNLVNLYVIWCALTETGFSF